MTVCKHTTAYNPYNQCKPDHVVRGSSSSIFMSNLLGGTQEMSSPMNRTDIFLSSQYGYKALWSSGARILTCYSKHGKKRSLFSMPQGCSSHLDLVKHQFSNYIFWKIWPTQRASHDDQARGCCCQLLQNDYLKQINRQPNTTQFFKFHEKLGFVK